MTRIQTELRTGVGERVTGSVGSAIFIAQIKRVQPTNLKKANKSLHVYFTQPSFINLFNQLHLHNTTNLQQCHAHTAA